MCGECMVAGACGGSRKSAEAVLLRGEMPAAWTRAPQPATFAFVDRPRVGQGHAKPQGRAPYNCEQHTVALFTLQCTRGSVYPLW